LTAQGVEPTAAAVGSPVAGAVVGSADGVAAPAVDSVVSGVGVAASEAVGSADSVAVAAPVGGSDDVAGDGVGVDPADSASTMSTICCS
jgi:hypothetical protein